MKQNNKADEFKHLHKIYDNVPDQDTKEETFIYLHSVGSFITPELIVYPACKDMTADLEAANELDCDGSQEWCAALSENDKRIIELLKTKQNGQSF